MLLALRYSWFRLLPDLLLVRCRSEASLQSDVLLLRAVMALRAGWVAGGR